MMTQKEPSLLCHFSILNSQLPLAAGEGEHLGDFFVELF